MSFEERKQRKTTTIKSNSMSNLWEIVCSIAKVIINYTCPNSSSKPLNMTLKILPLKLSNIGPLYTSKIQFI